MRLFWLETDFDSDDESKILESDEKNHIDVDKIKKNVTFAGNNKSWYNLDYS